MVIHQDATHPRRVDRLPVPLLGDGLACAGTAKGSNGRGSNRRTPDDGRCVRRAAGRPGCRTPRASCAVGASGAGDNTPLSRTIGSGRAQQDGRTKQHGHGGTRHGVGACGEGEQTAVAWRPGFVMTRGWARSQQAGASAAQGGARGAAEERGREGPRPSLRRWTRPGPTRSGPQGEGTRGRGRAAAARRTCSHARSISICGDEKGLNIAGSFFWAVIFDFSFDFSFDLSLGEWVPAWPGSSNLPLGEGREESGCWAKWSRQNNTLLCLAVNHVGPSREGLAWLGLGCGLLFRAGMKRAHREPGRHTPMCVTNQIK
jgi:hypothetical protein